MKAKFIAFEGGDASGKTTQARRVAEKLDAIFTREPGGTTVGESLRAILLDPNEIVAVRAEALLMAASRAQLVADIINPALTEGRHVVTDRFLASSLAYQGHASGLPVDDVLFLSLFATESLTPDLTVLIDIPVEESIKRRGQEPDRFEQENKLFHEKVRTGYLKLAEAENDKWVVIDGMGTPEEVAGFVDHAIKQRLDLP
ncbi:MAG: dTMP kinase [Acidimicrobiales bacterium]|jgi:dTMP kinase|nr:dTMP kinase [Acidimicrobiales bacterium]MDP6299226.1 dTMP kinase [Acidimicrobiales bacterium]HJM97970.1 dTMP kinase [Acidimicrobiales bacterium]